MEAFEGYRFGGEASVSLTCFLQMIVYGFVGIMSPNVGRSKSATIKEEIKNILEVSSFIGRLKKACISQIKQKLWKRLQRWKRKKIYPRVARRYSLRKLPRLSPLILWVVSSFQIVYVWS